MKLRLGYSTLTPTTLKLRRATFSVGALIIFLILGAVFLFIGLVALKNTQIDESWVVTQGEVVDVSSQISDDSTIYTPIIQYVVDGQPYRVTGGSGSTIYPMIGANREVAYNPDRPNQSKAVEGKGHLLLLLILPAIGIILLLSGIISFLRSLKRTRAIGALMRNGNKLQGVLIDTQSFRGNKDKSMNHRLIVAATDATGTAQNYVSDTLIGPLGHLEMLDFQKNPIPIDVFVDYSNPENYYVDFSTIPNLTPQRISELIRSATSNQKPPNSFV